MIPEMIDKGRSERDTWTVQPRLPEQPSLTSLLNPPHYRQEGVKLRCLS
jgi:hypothetical protein